jgi:ankyrin repeat protein
VNAPYSAPTPLTQVVNDGLTDFVKLLLEAGADPNIPNRVSISLSSSLCLLSCMLCDLQSWSLSKVFLRWKCICLGLLQSSDCDLGRYLLGCSSESLCTNCYCQCDEFMNISFSLEVFPLKENLITLILCLYSILCFLMI